MRLLRLLDDPTAAGPDPVLVLALDGWTDAGAAGSSAGELLLDTFEHTPLASVDPDALYDYRDRRPSLSIDRGRIGDLEWPGLEVDLLRPASGPPLILVTGAEPDFRWRALAEDLVELTQDSGARRYVGLGGVPGPLPHTRPVQLISTSSDPELLARFGRPHEQVVVPASAQVALEAVLAAAGLTTLGLWARLPHYVETDYPAATRALLERFSAFTGTPVDVSSLDAAIAEQREQLDEAAAASEEITEHVRSLESMYDAMVATEAAVGDDDGPFDGLSPEQVPSGDEIAAELERFLRGRAD
ncbi:PAC2 family protein [Nitriliruptoraceae bacterium ZYF776]|nr:PAC2 family protein [Profundirhabdus halotolerans]